MLRSILRFCYGILLVAVLAMPFGVYHSLSEPFVVGQLWGFCLPVGIVSGFCGFLVLVYPKLQTSMRVSLGSFMVIVGFLLFLSAVLFPKEYFINLTNGTSFRSSQIDVDIPVGNFFVFGLALFSVAGGLLLRSAREVIKSSK